MLSGTVLTGLLKAYSPSTITALVRSSAQADLLTSLGVTTVVGTVENIPLLTSLVVQSDVVLNFAVPFGGGDESIQTLVDGLELRASQGLVKPVLLQTSGSGTVMYGSDGLAGTDIWRVSRVHRSLTSVIFCTLLTLCFGRMMTTNVGRRFPKRRTFTAATKCELSVPEISRQSERADVSHLLASAVLLLPLPAG